MHLSEQGKRALAVEFEKFIDAEIERRNPLTKALESQQVTQLLPALEWNFIIQKIYIARHHKYNRNLNCESKMLASGPLKFDMY